jgi:hypothetical protein
MACNAIVDKTSMGVSFAIFSIGPRQEHTDRSSRLDGAMALARAEDLL